MRLGAAVTTAFACGLLFASSIDLTRFGFAQEGKGTKVAPAQVQSLAETGNAFEAIADHVTPSVVSIQIQRRQVRGRDPRQPGTMEDFFRNFEQQGPPREQLQEGTGSGFIVSKDGYILTNNHVVADADKVTVTLLDKRTFTAKVVGRDPTTDVAVIKIDGSNLPVAVLGDDNISRVGQWVLAIGNPLGLDFTVTAGIISAKGRPLPGLLEPTAGRYAITDYIQTDAAINPVMDDLLAYGKVRRSVIGVAINPASPEEAKAAGLEQVTGVVVGSYSYGADSVSPAKNAGIEPGDVIIAAEGKPVDRVSTLQRIVRSHKPGETLNFDVMRFGSKKTYRVKLVEAPDETRTVASANRGSVDEGAPSESRRFDKVGIAVEPVSAGLRAVVAEPYRRGLVVSDVSAMGPSYRKLTADQTVLYEVLNPGPRHALHSTADLDAVLSRLKAGDLVTFLVYDIAPQGQQGSTRAVTVRVQ